MVEFTFEKNLINQIGNWVNELAAPLMPPQVVSEENGIVHLEFHEHTPNAVMVGKLIRAVSGIRAALVLADLGYIAECASILRIVSDFCTEINAIGEALNSDGKIPNSIQTFVDQYFSLKPRTPEQLIEAERIHYISREEFLKAELRLAERANVDGAQLRKIHRFLNMTYDSYVHGAYETTMELYDLHTGIFMMFGHTSMLKRKEFVEAVCLKLHEVVIAIEITAAVTANTVVFQKAREARHTLDARESENNS